MIRRPPRSTLFPTRRSSDLGTVPEVRVLRWQGSGYIAALATANCFLVVPADRKKMEIGESVSVLRSEEHTSELQSRLHLVCRLLLEKKKTNILIFHTLKIYR